MFPGNYVEKIEEAPKPVLAPEGADLEAAPSPKAKPVTKKATASLPDKLIKSPTTTAAGNRRGSGTSTGGGGGGGSKGGAPPRSNGGGGEPEKPPHLQFCLISNFMGAWTGALFMTVGGGGLVWSEGFDFTTVSCVELN